MNIENKTDDRRVRKTKRALREGLAELMVEKELRSITVRELTGMVDMNRATFYAHYKDIYDLYEQMEDAVIEELRIILLKDYPSSHALYVSLLDYVAGNKHICRMLFGKNGSRSFLNRLLELFEIICIEQWLELWELKAATNQIRFYARYHVQGCIAIISRWVEFDFASPKDELVQMIAEIDRNMELYAKKRITG